MGYVARFIDQTTVHLSHASMFMKLLTVTLSAEPKRTSRQQNTHRISLSHSGRNTHLDVYRHGVHTTDLEFGPKDYHDVFVTDARRSEEADPLLSSAPTHKVVLLQQKHQAKVIWERFAPPIDKSRRTDDVERR